MLVYLIIMADYHSLTARVNCIFLWPAFLICAALLQLLQIADAQAQIYRCGDIWTTSACEAGAQPALIETERSPNEADMERRKKREIFLAFDTVRANAEREFGFSFASASAANLCYSDAYSLKECEEAVRIADQALNQRVLVAMEQTRARLAIEGEQSKVEQPTTIVIEQPGWEDFYYYDYPNRRYPKKHRDDPGGGIDRRPPHKPGSSGEAPSKLPAEVPKPPSSFGKSVAADGEGGFTAGGRR